MAELTASRRGGYAAARGHAGWMFRLPFPVRDLIRRWRELVGMTLGVGIALGIGMTLLAVSTATIQVLTADFRRSSADLFVLAEGGTLIPLLPGDSTGTMKQASHVLAQARAMPGVAAAVGAMIWPLQRQREGPRRLDSPVELFTVVGVDGDPSAIPGMLAMRQGRWVRRADEIVLGAKLSAEKHLGVGDTVRLDERDFAVVGVGRVRGVAYSSDGFAFAEYGALRQRAGFGDVLNVIAVQTSRPAEVRGRVADLGPYAVFDQADVDREARALAANDVAIYWVLIVLTLSIAALFVSTMLSHAVAERRLEFGTMRAIGVPNRTILLTVAAEATLVSIAAAGVGVLMSLFLGVLLNRLVAPQYGYETLYVADANLFLLVFALALGLGLVSGLLPARRAVRVDPVEVLREA